MLVFNKYFYKNKNLKLYFGDLHYPKRLHLPNLGSNMLDGTTLFF
jgi:hypothetical protein